MKKALVIGGSGFLGSYLLDGLHKQGTHIFATEHKKPIGKNYPIKLFPGGISAINTKLIDTIKPDVVFHCARPTYPKFRKYGRIAAARKAATLNKKLIKELQNSHSQPKLVFASGSLMYGNSPEPHDESSPLSPISYARQYFKGELPILDLIKSDTYPALMLRFPWLLGKGSWFQWFYLSLIKSKNAIPQFYSGNNMMEIVDVNNAAVLIVKYADEKKHPGIFNIFSDNKMNQNEFINEVANIFGKTIKNYQELFSGKLDKETVEAFTSNILLSTKHPDILNGFDFTSIEDSLKRIKKEFESG